jgi:peptidoglycan/LPS O-acetylase OafA/YrhL
MEQNRFIALDSWRGIAALAVVAFHFRNTAGFGGQAIFEGMYLFVDFFFVLSGFVIFSAYGEKLCHGYSVGRFLWLRLGRIYPLHIVTLTVLVVLKSLIVYPATKQWFPAPQESWDTVAANLLLIQSLNMFDFLTWNQPSWSISVEFFAYIAFALTVPLAGRKFWLICIAVVLSSPIFLFAFNDGKNLDATAHFGIVRCLYGFCSGVLAYEIFRRCPRICTSSRGDKTNASIIEITTVLLVVAFIHTAKAGPLSLAAPLLFGFVTIIFAQEAGCCTAVLRVRPVVYFGAISYSIYMMHMLVLSWWLSAVRGILFKLGGRDLFESVATFSREYIFMVGRNYSGLVLMLGLVTVVSTATYTVIEKPFREWSRRSSLFTVRADAATAYSDSK